MFDRQLFAQVWPEAVFVENLSQKDFFFFNQWEKKKFDVIRRQVIQTVHVVKGTGNMKVGARLGSSVQTQ